MRVWVIRVNEYLSVLVCYERPYAPIVEIITKNCVGIDISEYYEDCKILLTDKLENYIYYGGVL